MRISLFARVYAGLGVVFVGFGWFVIWLGIYGWTGKYYQLHSCLSSIYLVWWLVSLLKMPFEVLWAVFLYALLALYRVRCRCSSTRAAVACVSCQTDLRPFIVCHKTHATTARLQWGWGFRSRMVTEIRPPLLCQRPHQWSAATFGVPMTNNKGPLGTLGMGIPCGAV